MNRHPSWLAAALLTVMLCVSLPQAQGASKRKPAPPASVASVPEPARMTVDGNTVYRCTHGSAGTNYTNDPKAEDVKAGTCKAVNAPNFSVVPAGPITQPGTPITATKPPEPFIKNNNNVPPDLQSARDELQRQSETRNGNERNYQNYLDRIKPYQDRVQQLEKRYGLSSQ